MNKLWIIWILTSISCTSTAQDREIPKEQIPKEITAYIETHFQEKNVLKASFDDHLIYKKYKISLKENISLEFSPEYKVIEIKSKSKLPDTVIPEEIHKYVETNYPKNVITDWELEDGNQQIELDNGLNIEFTLKGQFIKAKK